MKLRTILLSLLMAIVVNILPAWSSLILHSSRMDYAHVSVAFLIPFFLLLFVNQLLWKRSAGLSSSELIVICCVGLVAATMQGEWLSGYLLGTISSPYYFATPENRWEDVLLPHMPLWAILTDQAAIRTFHESIPPEESIPWGAWLQPLMWWMTLVVTMLVAGLSLTTIFRRQWAENEKLAFPVAVGILELTGAEDGESRLRTLFRSPLFWIGFLFTFGLLAWNIVGWSVTGWPMIPLLRNRSLRLGRGFPAIMFVVHPMTIAFGYFTKSEVLFSIWSFHLVAVLQAGIFNRVGYDIGGADPWGSFHTAIGWQSFGGMIVFVGWGIWIARNHLRDVFRQAVFKEQRIDDSNELMSYRVAFWLFIGCSTYAFLFLHQAGMDWVPSIVFWFGTAILYLGLARIIVESGLVFIRGPITAQAFTWHLLGPAVIGPKSAIAIGLTQTFFCDAKTLGITLLAHIPRFGQSLNPRVRRQLGPLVIGGCVVGAAAVMLFTLFESYHGVGAYNFGVVSFRGEGGSAAESWQIIAKRLQQTFATDWKRVSFLGIGGIISMAMVGLRYWIPSFSIHPIGFAVGASLIMRSSASSIFIVWMVKSIILRIGSLSLYRKYAPLFLGMMVGHTFGIGLGVLVDALLFPGEGHKLNRW
jgi:hypothetical protein